MEHRPVKIADARSRLSLTRQFALAGGVMMPRKLWKTGGLVVYARDPALAGQRFTPTPNLQAAWSGRVMAKGDAPYGARVAEAAFRIMAAAAPGYGSQFPDAADSANETGAAPKIRADSAGFPAAVARFATDAAAAAGSKPADPQAFPAAFGAVAGTCTSCHESCRIMKP
jgi:cytochrome c556